MDGANQLLAILDATGRVRGTTPGNMAGVDFGMRLAGRPMLEYWLDLVIDAGILDLVILADEDAANQKILKDVIERRGVLSVYASMDEAERRRGKFHFILRIQANAVGDMKLTDFVHRHRENDNELTRMLVPLALAPNRTRWFMARGVYSGPVSARETSAFPQAWSEAGITLEKVRSTDGSSRESLPLESAGKTMGWVHRGRFLSLDGKEETDRRDQLARSILAERGWNNSGMRGAIYLDRDGTVIENPGYLSDPRGVKLFSDAAAAIQRWRARGYACVIVTNQSGIGRGMYTEQEMHEVNRELCRQLGAAGTALDGIYFCPVAPQVDDPDAIEHPDRKPGPGMLLKAARDLSLDVARSWMIGDSLRDALAGKNAGCKGNILLGHGEVATLDAAKIPPGVAVTNDLKSACDLVLTQDFG
ncbi:MAG: HAD-IIIA family hydrolase [Planctomycetota bacterium]